MGQISVRLFVAPEKRRGKAICGEGIGRVGMAVENRVRGKPDPQMVVGPLK